MNSNINKFNNLLIKSILSQNKFKIEKVIDLKEIKTFFFTKDIFSKVKLIIEMGGIDLLLKSLIQEEKTSEYLSIVTFKDENDKQFFAMIYDNDELWQDPEVMEIGSNASDKLV